MRVFFSLLMFFSLTFAEDATIEVIKQVDTLPSIAVEDASVNYSNEFKMKFFKMLSADLNVLSIFNVDRYYRQTYFDNSEVLKENQNMDYVLRYKLFEGDNGNLNTQIKLISNAKIVFSKSYKIKTKKVYMFVAHTIAYDINKFMNQPPVDWMKRRVVFSRLVGSKKTELVISDYTLTYQHVVIRGGLDVFPKWADSAQTKIYYTSLKRHKPTLRLLDIKRGKIKNILSSDGMIVCSDVSKDSKRLLLTMAPYSQPDIYMYNVNTKRLKRLTRYNGIDVNAQFMGQDKIVFVSGRLGYPNIFSKKIGSKAVEQLVYYGKSNSACSVSGEYVVYKARESSNVFSSNTFNLHLISTKTDFIRRLTASGINEFPRFSKDGDAILFIKNYKNQSSLGVIRVKYNKNYLFPLRYGKIQSMDW